MQTLKRQTRIERLSHLHSDCELNYARLHKLIGGATGIARVYQAGSEQQLELEISVSRESKYTRLLSLDGRMDILPWLGSQKMAVRMYDDARMAEVVSIDRRRVRMINYEYPNREMYVPDEKNQLNHFLGCWLEHTLAKGLPKLVDE